MRNEQGELLKTDTKFNEDGPHFNLYKDYPDFDIHYLLTQYSESHSTAIKWQFLADALRTNFNKEVRLIFMGIDDIFSVGTIKGKVESLLNNELSGDVVEVFMNPGAPSMQIAWYLIGSELSDLRDIKFFRRREKQFTEGNTSEKEYVQYETSEYARVTNIRDSKRLNISTFKPPFITTSLRDTYNRASQVAGNDKTTVLITGETGTGKEEVAKYIHANSNRNTKPFVVINCAAFRGDLLESRLFGYEKGAFTGALKTTKGAFEEAQGGTIFLDEIGDITSQMQITLLRVLQEKEISRIGSTKKISLDIRIITATNKDLWQMSKDNEYREDLYYRLAIAEIEIPTFRSFSKKERKAWITYFLETLYTKLEKRYLSKISKEVWGFLLAYPFRGNIREVQNTIETFYTFCDKQITYGDIPKRMLRSKEANSFKLDVIIKNHIKEVVDFCGGNLAEAGRLLDKDRATVRKYIK